MKHKILYFNIILIVKGVKPVERNASFHDYFARVNETVWFLSTSPIERNLQ